MTEFVTPHAFLYARHGQGHPPKSEPCAQCGVAFSEHDSMTRDGIYSRGDVADLVKTLPECVAQRIVPGSLWRHYKGNAYRVLAIARHSETGETLVVYRREDASDTWARPVSMWLEIVEPFGVPRFKQID